MLIISGAISLLIGAVGILLPILPTTPFVLVSAACFAASSPKLYKKLLHTKYFGEFIDNYRNKSGVAKEVKIKALVFLWVALIISALIFKSPTVIIILAIVGISVTVHIVLLKKRKEKKEGI